MSPLTSSQRTRAWQKRNPDKLPTAAEKRAYDRKFHLRKKYGLTPEAYDAILAGQGGRCAICQSTGAGGRFGVFHVDHMRGAGTVRGLLCARCNLGLGSFSHDPQVLRAAIEYLCWAAKRKTA